LKKTHRSKEARYEKQDVFKAIDFNNEWLEAGTNNRRKTPIKGKIKRVTSKLVIFNKKKSNINIL